jgi:hypothetical protein
MLVSHPDIVGDDAGDLPSNTEVGHLVSDTLAGALAELHGGGEGDVDVEAVRSNAHGKNSFVGACIAPPLLSPRAVRFRG